MEMTKAMTMEELQMLEVERNEETADFCLFTCLITCTVSTVKNEKAVAK